MRIVKEIAIYIAWVIVVVALVIGWTITYDTVVKETTTNKVLTSNSTITSYTNYETQFILNCVEEARYYTDSLGQIVEYCALYNSPDDGLYNTEVTMDKETFECLKYSMNNPNSDAYEFTILMYNDIPTLLLVDKD